jgi:hypothetical protein
MEFLCKARHRPHYVAQKRARAILPCRDTRRTGQAIVAGTDYIASRLCAGCNPGRSTWENYLAFD